MYLAANVFIIAYAGVVICNSWLLVVAVENLHTALIFSVAKFKVKCSDGALRALDHGWMHKRPGRVLDFGPEERRGEARRRKRSFSRFLFTP